MAARLNITKEFLIEEYINKGKSSRKIAEILKCGRGTILRHLKKNNIEVRLCPKDKKVSIKFITEEFAKEGYTLITTEYTGSQQKLYYICPANHPPSSTTWNHWLRGTRCRQCKAEARRIKHKTINEIEYKWCSKCETWKKLDCFNKDKKTVDDHCPYCKKCINQKSPEERKKAAKRAKLRREKNPEKYKKRNNTYNEKHREKKRLYAVEYRKENPEKIKIAQKKGRKKNSSVINARNAKRRALKLNAMSEDVNPKEVAFYRAVCDETNEILDGIYFNVDHIQPLTKGGLHHEDNLQILEAKSNNQKNNKWPLTPEEEIKYKGIRF